MSWFNQSNFGNVETAYGGSMATGEPINNRHVVVPTRPDVQNTPIQRIVDDRISLGTAITLVHVESSEKELIKKKYNMSEN